MVLVAPTAMVVEGAVPDVVSLVAGAEETVVEPAVVPVARELLVLPATVALVSVERAVVVEVEPELPLLPQLSPTRPRASTITTSPNAQKRLWPIPIVPPSPHPLAVLPQSPAAVFVRIHLSQSTLSQPHRLVKPTIPRWSRLLVAANVKSSRAPWGARLEGRGRSGEEWLSCCWLLRRRSNWCSMRTREPQAGRPPGCLRDHRWVGPRCSRS